jgi:hypothetical protein
MPAEPAEPATMQRTNQCLHFQHATNHGHLAFEIDQQFLNLQLGCTAMLFVQVVK